MEADPDEEYMKSMILKYEIEHHCRTVFEDNEVGVYDEKEILHSSHPLECRIYFSSYTPPLLS